MRFLFKVTRPVIVAAVFLATWVSAALSEAPADLGIYAAAAMAMGGLGASLFHYGAAYKMYARKIEAVNVRYPFLLVASGFFAFSASIAIADWLLPNGSTTILWFNVMAVSLYGHTLCKWWFSKNITIALVCVTPIALGWWIGTTTHPAMPYLVITVLCACCTREIIKDVTDREANEGERVTLPILLDDEDACKIAGIVGIVATASAFCLISYGWEVAVAAALLGGASLVLLIDRKTGWTRQMITVGMFILIAAFGL